MPPRKRLKPAAPTSEPIQTRSRTRGSSASAASTSSARTGSAAPLASGSGSNTSTRRASTISMDDYNEDAYADSGSGFEYESDGPGTSHVEDNDSDIVMVDNAGAQRAGGSSKGRKDEVVMLSSDEEPPPEPVKPKGKLTSRKQFAADLADLAKKFNSVTYEGPVSGLKRDEGDDMVQLVLKHPDFPRGLKLSLYFPELSGYPKSHEAMGFAGDEDVPESVQAAISEVAQLPARSDRSLAGLVDFLVGRIVRGEANQWIQAPTQSQHQETDEEGLDYEDDLYDAGVNMAKNSEVVSALRADFKSLVKEGYQPGFTRLSELDLVVSVAKRVNLLGVPARALQAWDSRLITGEVVYLVLLMNFGSTYPVDLDNQTSGQVRFRVGVSPTYKPSKAAISAAFRAHSSNPYTPGEFGAISLSNPLNALMNDKFQQIVQIRRSNDRVGWAGAEQHCFTSEAAGQPLDKKAARVADKDEKTAADANASLLPKDPMASTKTAGNFPLLAFSYLIRRFVMCPRFCLNCFKRCDMVITPLKPFVCDNPLCLFQLIQLGLGPSLEHEIETNAPAVDLLVQLAYIAAKEGGLRDELLPVGLELKVPRAGGEAGETDDLDDLANDDLKRAGIAALIVELPPINEMKKWLLGEDMTADERAMHRTRKLIDMRDGKVSISAWRLLRFIVASNTSYLKLIEDEDELVQGIPAEYRQFRFIVGDPAKEHRLAESIKAAQKVDANAVTYPTLYAFHGSAVRNWSSILRQGLHFKETINGRAHGHGVYFAIQGEVSLGTYANNTLNSWKNAEFAISKLAAICEVTNRPQEFVSSRPYLVCDKLDWIQCRVLIVQRNNLTVPDENQASSSKKPGKTSIKTIPLDPKFPLTLNTVRIAFPDVEDKLQRLENALGDVQDELHESDTEIMKEPPAQSPAKRSSARTSNRSTKRTSPPISGSKQSETPPPDPFEPADASRLQLIRMLPPPKNPSRTALSMIQKEMKAMMKTQEKEGPTKAGFYYDPERSNDNLFTWIVELPQGSFDQDIPLAKDMKQKGVKSILMEIRFGDSYPFSPPFFRVVHPRFLPFIHGGGGHVTGGGSICMDLLTSDGWSSVYSIEAILLQIRMAMSNLEPRPARLDPSTWNSPYSMQEAIEGFKRAANTHGWTVPPELDQLAKQG
ncbi:hypothetical protein JCM10908_000179 [Rhodotorula pacifica]|uniref:uncharacterized protein n=1 Tax=Rhodotorula pacifica TaxID=1495444 RepID=UPI0031805C11